MNTNEQLVTVAARLPKSLADRLDAYTNERAREEPGLRLSRSDAVRVLLIKALGAAEQGASR